MKVVKYFPKSKVRSFIKIILDTGTNTNITGNKNIFPKITHVANKSVILGDGSAKFSVLGIGVIYISIGNYYIQLHDVLYVPQLQDTLFSITEHIKYELCKVDASNNKYNLIFPTLHIRSLIVHEVFIPITPSISKF